MGIINDVLDMSKIEAGKTVFKYSDFSILDLVQELNTIFHTQIYEKQQTLTIIKENIQHEWVNGDQVHLMQIFSNLLSNAVKYTQEGGKIQFFVEECETKSSVYAKYRFLVSDNGMGMSADFKDTILMRLPVRKVPLQIKYREPDLEWRLLRIWLRQWEVPLMWRVNWAREAVLRFSWI